MIHINLLGEKVDRSGTYILQLLLYFGSVVCALCGCLFIYQRATAELALLKDDTTRIEQEVKILEKQTAEVKDLEQKEQLLREKLSTIAQLKIKKHGPVHVLADMSASIPEKTWLEALKERDGVIEIKGIALDNQTIAMFIGELEKSAYFEGVDLIQSKQYIKDDVKMKEFGISFKVENPLAQLTQQQNLPDGATEKKDKNNPGQVSDRAETKKTKK